MDSSGFGHHWDQNQFADQQQHGFPHSQALEHLPWEDVEENRLNNQGEFLLKLSKLIKNSCFDI